MPANRGLDQLLGVAPVISLTADQDDYDPTGLGSASILRIEPTADRIITGMVPKSGQVVRLFNIATTNIIVLANDSSSSTETNRFDFGRNVIVRPNDCVVLWYDDESFRWRLLETKSYPTVENQVTTNWARPITDFASIYDVDANVVQKIHPIHLIMGGRNFSFVAEEFIHDNGAIRYWWGTEGASTGSVNASNDNHVGVLRVESTNGWYGFSTPDPYAFHPQGGPISMMVIYKSSQVSDSTNPFFVKMGLHHDQHVESPDQGIVLRYSHANNGGKWEFYSNNNDVPTVVDTGVLFEEDTWYRLEINISADGVTATASVNGSTPVVINDGSIPLTDLQFTAIEMIRLADGDPRAVLIDYAQIVKEFVMQR